MSKPVTGTYHASYEPYLATLPDYDPYEVLQQDGIFIRLGRIAEEKAHYSYAPGKWTVAEVFGHVLDTERIFAYRSLAILRGEPLELSGFDQDHYVAQGNFNHHSLTSLLNALKAARQNTLWVFQDLTPEQLARKGRAGGKDVWVGLLAYVIAGHAYYHAQKLKELYGV